MLYQQTKNTLCVKKFLGSRNVENTLLYIQLEVVIFQESDEVTDSVTEKLDEAVKLMETGFEYVTDIIAGKSYNFVKIFCKSKQHAENA